MNSEHLHILQHSLGLDQYSQGTMYRNRYVSDPDDDLVELVQLGFLEDHGPMEICGGMRFYSVTDAGKSAMFQASPKPPKICRSRQSH